MSVQENFTEKFKVARNYKIIRRFFGKEPADLTQDLGISKQNISTWENENGNPGSKFVDQMSKYFRLPRDVFYRDGLTVEDLKAMKNHTSVQNGSDNTRKPLGGDPEVYRTIVEGNTEYVLIPRTVLQDTKLISTEQIANDRKIMDKLLEQNEKMIAKLLTSSEAELPGVKKGKNSP
jgi:DNA-binding XRE family transcriptional regulator